MPSPYRYVGPEHALPRSAGDWPSEYVAGYVTPLVAAPGSAVEVHVSTPADSILASSVRLLGRTRSGAIESQPALSLAEPARFEGGEQELRTGSCVMIGPSAHFAATKSLTVSFWLLPTALTPVPQVLVASCDVAGERGWLVMLDMDRGLGLEMRMGTRAHRTVYVDERFPGDCWSHVLVRIDVPRDDVALVVRPKGGEPQLRRASVLLDGFASHDRVFLAAPDGRGRPYRPEGNGCFNGKLADFRLFGNGLSCEEVTRLSREPNADIRLDPVCHVDLSDAIGTSAFADRSQHHHAVLIVNAPACGVTGPTWKEATTSHYVAPDEYAALHFHDDDLEDAHWEATATIHVPCDAGQTGVFAARIETNDCIEHLPFFVTDPAAVGIDSGIAVLVPTLTYLAYAAEQEVVSNPGSYLEFTGKEPSEYPFTWRDEYPVRHGLRSLYDVHSDGSSVIYASTRRPLPNLAPDYAWPLIGGPHGLGSDLMLLGWLRRTGFDAGVLTDHDLHRHGARALRKCRVLLTGSHPEYWSPQMLDALESFLIGGGRLLYLGGNGFYWVADVLPDREYIMEVRRGFTGTRPCTSAPGEAWLTTTELAGGIWRERGRPPQRLVGVGTAATGAGQGRPYRRTCQPDTAGAFAFDGVRVAEIGVGGSILGAAAAYEFDRADIELGTPAEAMTLASAGGFSELYQLVEEDRESSSGAKVDGDRLRADMLLFARPAGGCVFAVGSAAWNASLELDDRGETETGRVTRNILERFRDTPDGVSPLRPRESGRQYESGGRK